MQALINRITSCVEGRNWLTFSMRAESNDNTIQCMRMRITEKAVSPVHGPIQSRVQVIVETLTFGYVLKLS